MQTTWLLTDLAESLGRQALFTHQSPQKLKVLREHAIIESSVSSNRIEGVTVEPGRLKAVLFGKQMLRNRDEEEVRGYRKALDLIHSKGKNLPVTEKTILLLHKMIRPDAWEDSIRNKTLPPLVSIAAFNHDFLCIHPFRDGNGRVSRLLFLLQAYHLGFEVGRYISLERIIEENKERYYETLEKSSHHWHEAKHDPWPIINHLLWILKTACKEFEERVGQIKGARGSKKDLIIATIRQIEDSFTVADLREKCPGVSVDMIRRVLKDLQAAKSVACIERGQKAKWRKLAN